MTAEDRRKSGDDFLGTLQARLVRRRGRLLIRLEHIKAPCVRRWEARRRRKAR